MCQIVQFVVKKICDLASLRQTYEKNTVTFWHAQSYRRNNYKYVNLADEVWHAGDIGDLKVTDELKKLKPLRAVYGNIDDDKARMEFSLNNRFMCEGVAVWITHIGGYPGKYNQAIREEIKLNPPKLFICGHSHILKVQFDKTLNLLYMNPGACGIYGFHQIRTMLRFEIDGDKIQGLEIIEIGKK